MTQQSSHRRGVTLVEITVSTMIVGVMLVAALETVGSAARTHELTATLADAWRLAERYAAKIAADDYESLIDKWSGLEDPPRDENGDPIDEMAAWIVKVSVTRCKAVPSGRRIIPLPQSSSDEGLRRVTVEVVYAQAPEQRSIEFEILRSQYGAGQFSANTVKRLVVDWSLSNSDAENAVEPTLHTASGIHLNDSPAP